MSYLMKDLPPEEKPREKAKLYGVEFLSDAELFAILLRTGTKSLSVKELSIKILEKIKEVEGISNLRLPSLLDIHGIGETKAITILATLELSKRMSQTKPLHHFQIKQTKDVWTHFYRFFAGESQEKFLVVFLDTRHQVLNQKIVFQGTANQSLIHPRDIFKEAILNNAVKILCVHNHPTGCTLPSRQDKEVTKKLYECGSILGIPLLDHVIVSEDSYYSFLEKGEIS